MQIGEYRKNRKVTCSFFILHCQYHKDHLGHKAKGSLGSLQETTKVTEQIAMAMSVATFSRARKFREREGNAQQYNSKNKKSNLYAV